PTFGSGSHLQYASPGTGEKTASSLLGNIHRSVSSMPRIILGATSWYARYNPPRLEWSNTEVAGVLAPVWCSPPPPPAPNLIPRLGSGVLPSTRVEDARLRRHLQRQVINVLFIAYVK
ncbi:unnamed protein product, partial [Ectocarpus sp. 4 AP-2014]